MRKAARVEKITEIDGIDGGGERLRKKGLRMLRRLNTDCWFEPLKMVETVEFFVALSNAPIVEINRVHRCQMRVGIFNTVYSERMARNQ